MPEFDTLVPVKPLEVEVDFGGPDALLALTFDANKVTPKALDEMRRRLIEDDDMLAVARMFAGIILSWNLTAAGQPVPVSVDTLSRFPIGHVGLIMEVIGRQPSDAEGNASPEHSSTQPLDSSAPVETPLNGASTSASPLSSASPLPT